MAEKLIQDTTLTNVANAIRSKDGTSAPIQVSDFATRISNIPSGEQFYGDTFYNLIYGTPSEE